MNDLLFDRVHKGWEFTRGLTLDLLRRLDQPELLYEPGGGLGAFWKQFRHLGRVQANYVEALETGTISFDLPKEGYQGGTSQADLLSYLTGLDNRLDSLLDAFDPSQKIAWPGSRIDLFDHLTRLVNHETLHHGEFVAYMGQLGKPFPPSWKALGL